MNLIEYSTIIEKTAIFPKDIAGEYISLGIHGEYGEFCDKLKKIYRDKNGVFSDEDKLALIKELGDYCWYVTAGINYLGVDVNVIETIILDSGFKNEIVKASKDENLYTLVGITLALSPCNVDLSEVLNMQNPDNDIRVKKAINGEYIAESAISFGSCREIAKFLGYTFKEVLQMNYEKLMKRRETNTLHGNGDNREV